MSTLNQSAQMAVLVQRAKDVLDAFDGVDNQSSPRAWELVVQLQEIIDQLRELNPPSAFRRRSE